MTSEAVAIVYRGTFGTPVKVTFTPKNLGLDFDGDSYEYQVVEVFDNKILGTFKPDEPISVMVNPTGEPKYI